MHSPQKKTDVGNHRPENDWLIIHYFTNQVQIQMIAEKTVEP
jgi:hypothetical protein